MRSAAAARLAAGAVHDQPGLQPGVDRVGGRRVDGGLRAGLHRRRLGRRRNRAPLAKPGAPAGQPGAPAPSRRAPRGAPRACSTQMRDACERAQGSSPEHELCAVQVSLALTMPLMALVMKGMPVSAARATGWPGSADDWAWVGALCAHTPPAGVQPHVRCRACLTCALPAVMWRRSARRSWCRPCCTWAPAQGHRWLQRPPSKRCSAAVSRTWFSRHTALSHEVPALGYRGLKLPLS
jgi:hypothetical protein